MKLITEDELAITARFVTAMLELRRAGFFRRKMDFAAQVGLTPAQLSYIQKGDNSRGLGVKHLKAMVEAYPIRAYWLLTGRGAMWLGQTKVQTNVPKIRQKGDKVPLYSTDNQYL